jgi:prepilin-type N-terminal cleavage/methylation domain-containing protein
MNRGFTMIELTVTISIMVIIAALVLVNFPGFSRQAAIERAAQEVSLALRSAQARALAVQKFVPTGQFPQGYGAFFSNVTNASFILFADLDKNGLYTSEEKVDEIVLPKPLMITRLLAKEKTNPPGVHYRELHIVYYRPDPVIVMHGVDAGGISINLGAGDVEIILGSLDGSSSARKVIAWTTGQVSVEK